MCFASSFPVNVLEEEKEREREKHAIRAQSHDIDIIVSVLYRGYRVPSLSLCPRRFSNQPALRHARNHYTLRQISWHWIRVMSAITGKAN